MMTRNLSPTPIKIPIIFVVKPKIPDTLNQSGGFVHGYREIIYNPKTRDGFVLIGNARYGCEKLSMFQGQYVYVESTDYWNTSVWIAGDPDKPAELLRAFKCRRL